MKKWISILLLTCYLVSTTELYQLLKIPVLIEHFLEHKGDNPETTLSSFFKMHYDNPAQDEDYQTDQKLPFVTHSSHLVLVFTVNPDFFIEIKKQILPDHHQKIHSYDDDFYNKDAFNSIWQPPKTC